MRAFGEKEVNVRGGSSPSVAIDVISAFEVNSWTELDTAVASPTSARKEIIFLKKEVSSNDWNNGTNAITINRPITLRAEEPVTITRGNDSASFFIINSGVVLKLEGNLTLDGNKTSFQNAVSLINVDNGELYISNGVTLRNNNCGKGGGVIVNANGKFYMSGGTITGNEANAGGEVYVDGGSFAIIRPATQNSVRNNLSNNVQNDSGTITVHGISSAGW